MSHCINWQKLSQLRVVIAAAASIPLLAGVAVAQPLEVVKIGWPAGFASNMAHLTFGKELGLFKDDKLDYEVVSMQGTYPVIQQILSGGFHTGYVGVETAVNALQPGATPLPLRFVFNYARQSIWEIVVPDASPIKTLADLKGKTIGIAGPTFGYVPVTKAALGGVGVPASHGANEFRADLKELRTKLVEFAERLQVMAYGDSISDAVAPDVLIDA